jgi:hypothetical protein
MFISPYYNNNNNNNNKEAEKILNHKDLTTEIQRMWNVKTRVIPVITGATGTNSKSFRNTWATYRETMTLRSYRKQPYWAPQTYCG